MQARAEHFHIGWLGRARHDIRHPHQLEPIGELGRGPAAGFQIRAAPTIGSRPRLRRCGRRPSPSSLQWPSRRALRRMPQQERPRSLSLRTVRPIDSVPVRESAPRPLVSRPLRDDRGWGTGHHGRHERSPIGRQPALARLLRRAHWSLPVSRSPATAARAGGSATLNGRGATFEWWTMGLALCPFGWQPTPGFELQACAGGDAGWLTGKGQPSDPLPRPIRAPSSGPKHPRRFTSAGRSRISSPVFEAAGEVGLPFVRHRYHFDRPSEDVFEVPLARLGTTPCGWGPLLAARADGAVWLIARMRDRG